MTADTLTKDQSLELMQAEIERLRDKLVGYMNETQTKAAEIERLREELRLCIHVDKHIHITSGLNIEIERLQKLNATLLAAKHVEIVPSPIPESFVIQELQKANVALHADIARMREEGQRDYDGMREFQQKFIDADHEVCRLREGERAADAEIDRLRKQVTQRGARLQLIREWMEICPSGPTQNLWVDFTYDNPEAAEWFDADGSPR